MEINNINFGSNNTVKKCNHTGNIPFSSILQGNLPEDRIELTNQKIIKASETVNKLTEIPLIFKGLGDNGKKILDAIAKNPSNANKIDLSKENLSFKQRGELKAVFFDISQLSPNDQNELQNGLTALKLGQMPTDDKIKLSSLLVALHSHRINPKIF